MYREQRGKRAAAAAAVSKIKNDIEALEKISDARVKNQKSAKARARSTGTKVPNHEPSNFQIKRNTSKSKDAKGDKKPVPAGNHNFVSEQKQPRVEERRITTHERHMRRRALRQVHSNQKMRLSRRSSAKIRRKSVTGTPVYSPILAQRLNLTPDADSSCIQDKQA